MASLTEFPCVTQSSSPAAPARASGPCPGPAGPSNFCPSLAANRSWQSPSNASPRLCARRALRLYRRCLCRSRPQDIPALPSAQVLGEPVGRDTANAVGFAAAVLHRQDPASSMAVLTADHLIQPVAAFQSALETAFAAVDKHPELLVTFGIMPTFPATGYGYVQRGDALPDLPAVHKVLAFKEKPDVATAEKYLAAGSYAWNSGMFVWKTGTILEQLKQHLPASYQGVMAIAAAWGTNRQDETLRRIYPMLPKISIDFAVMEKAPHVATVAMPVQWLDIGSWTSFAETLPADSRGNRASGVATQHVDSSNILAVSEAPATGAGADHLIATINCHDLIIIHTARATLVCPAKDTERIKQLVAEVAKHHGPSWV